MFTILPLFLLGIKALRHSINPRQLWLCSVPIGPSKLTKPVRPMNFPQEGNPPMIPKWLDHDTIRLYQVCHREHVLNMSYFIGKRQLPTITADCRDFFFVSWLSGSVTTVPSKRRPRRAGVPWRRWTMMANHRRQNSLFLGMFPAMFDDWSHDGS